MLICEVTQRSSSVGATGDWGPEAEIDAVRGLLRHEPRGHADLHGCRLASPDDEWADFHALFWHQDGYSTARGHSRVAAGASSVETDRVPASDGGATNVINSQPSAVLDA
jgi:proline racemase